MHEDTRGDGPSDEIRRCAREAEAAIHQLCRTATERPGMTPADVSAVLADLEALVAALPQVATQLGDILHNTEHEYRLAMDTMAEHDDPAQAIETARLHLSAARGPAEDLHHLLDATHNATAHITAAERPIKPAWLDPTGAAGVRRPADPPPATPLGRLGPDCAR